MVKLIYRISFLGAILLAVPVYAQSPAAEQTTTQNESTAVNIPIDQDATDKAPWKIGDVVAEGVLETEFDENGEEEKVYRKFLGVTPKGLYLVQSFFTSGDAKLTDAYLLLTPEDVTDMQFSNHERHVEGEYIQWYRNGIQHTHNQYRGGKLDGLQKTWYNNGKIMLEVTYRDGLAQGLATVWDIDDFKISEVTYMDNKIKEIKNYAYGQYEIAHFVTSEDGQSSQVTYRYRNGQKESEGLMLKGEKKQGPWTSWYESGQMRDQGEYSNNEKIGHWKSWDADGNLIEEKDYPQQSNNLQ